MVSSPCVVVVSDHSDLVSNLVSTILRARGVKVVWQPPGTLGGLPIELESDTFRIGPNVVHGVLFRASLDSTFSTDFVIQDQSFGDAEIRATWLAVMHLDTILAINRYDAIAWFEGAGWPVWHKRLIEADVPSALFVYGSVPNGDIQYWYPYVSSRARQAPSSIPSQVLGSALTSSTQKQTTLIVCGNVVNGESSPVVKGAMRVLEQAGMQLMEITTDVDGHVLIVNTQPTISDIKSANRAAHILADTYYAHLHRR